VIKNTVLCDKNKFYLTRKLGMTLRSKKHSRLIFHTTKNHTRLIFTRIPSLPHGDPSVKLPWFARLILFFVGYDSSPVVNGIGRLSNAWTQSASVGTCSTTPPTTGFWAMRSITAYDSMGRITNEQQYTPANQASGTPYAPVYTYDLAGNLLTSTSGVGPTYTNTYYGAGRLQTLISNWTNNSTFPTLLFSSLTESGSCPGSITSQYTAFGGLANAAFGNGLTLNRAYDNLLRTTCEIDTGTTVTSAT